MPFKYPIILDGGFATELERGFNKDLSGKLWSAQCLEDDPEAIKAVHKHYYEAGANVATTSSYQASIEGFTQAGYSKEHAIELMQRSVILANEARNEFKQAHPDDTEQRLIALSIGCYGATLANGAEYTGNYGDVSLEQLVKFHQSRLDIFLATPDNATVDFIVFETIPSYLEAQAIKKIVEANSKLPPVAVAFQCRSESQIADGTPVIKALGQFDGLEQVFATGFNCTKPKFVEDLLRTFHEHNKDKVLIVYPDGGEEWNAVARSWDTSSKIPEESFGCMMAGSIKKYGPKIIVGGCCGTVPRHIKNIIQFIC